jgi:hypothetical protein
LENPVPSQAGHFISPTFRLVVFMNFISRKGTSNQIRRHPLNLRHIVVKNGLRATIIPFDSYARPIPFSDGAPIIAFQQTQSPTPRVLDWLPVIRVADYCVAERTAILLSALPIDWRKPQSPPVHFFAKSVGILLH